MLGRATTGRPDREHGLGPAGRNVGVAALDVVQVLDLGAVLREKAPHRTERRLELLRQVGEQVLELAHRVGADEDARLVVRIAVHVHRHPLAHLVEHASRSVLLVLYPGGWLSARVALLRHTTDLRAHDFGNRVAGPSASHADASSLETMSADGLDLARTARQSRITAAPASQP